MELHAEAAEHAGRELDPCRGGGAGEEAVSGATELLLLAGFGIAPPAQGSLAVTIRGFPKSAANDSNTRPADGHVATGLLACFIRVPEEFDCYPGLDADRYNHNRAGNRITVGTGPQLAVCQGTLKRLTLARQTF